MPDSFGETPTDRAGQVKTPREELYGGMSADVLQEICKAATHGRWTQSAISPTVVYLADIEDRRATNANVIFYAMRPEDAVFATAAHRALPDLLSAVGGLRAALDAAEAEAQKYKEALEAIGTFCESPDWEHDSWSDDAGYHLDCIGRERVRVMVEEALT